jgi:carboxyl-terminal processing protease
MRRRGLQALALVGAGLGMGLALGAGLSLGMARADAPDPYDELETLARMLTHVETHHVDPVDTRQLVDAALDGVATSLDPHSAWLDVRAREALEDDAEGRYEGIGVEVRPVAEGLRVLRVLGGGPAERAGVQADDRIVAIDGQPIGGLDLDATSRLLRGPRGTTVVLTVARDGGTVRIETRRDRIEVAAVEAGPLPGEVAYVHLRTFQAGAATDVGREARTLYRQGARRGLILDLRGNGGGLLDEAVALADLFLDEGPIVTTRGRATGEEVAEASAGGLPADWPLVVLVDRGSASASEVVAGALQDTDRATLVGTRTYGKGTVQTLFHAPDGRAFKLTVARYYTPAGTPVAPEEGRSPDIAVPSPGVDDPHEALRAAITAQDLEADAREELLELVDRLPPGEASDPRLPWSDPIATRWRRDPQLRAALVHLGADLSTAEP